jgi:dienelactone hydrolase
MNGAGGTTLGWQAMALWLQNRGEKADPGSGESWRDPNWFPALDAEASFAVLTFDYQSTIGNYRADAQAAVVFASTLDGLDANQILTVGSSIGADSAAEACDRFNQAVKVGDAQGECKGAFSFSPASKTFYADAAPSLLEEGAILFCLASTGDALAARACASQDNENFHPYIFDGEVHGMYLISPSLFPSDPEIEENPLEILLDFLELTTGLPVAEK